MSKYRFSYTERYALWKAYDGKCFYCEEPLDFPGLTIDHILPEWLSEKPLELKQIRRAYELNEIFPNFQINDFTNWAPSHNKCNIRKGSDILPKKMTLLLLKEIERHLPKVISGFEALKKSRGASRILGSLSAAIENKHLSIQEVYDCIAEIEKSQYANEPLVITFGLRIDDVVGSGELPGIVPLEYASLCDWLELDLVKHLRSILTSPFHYTQPSERSGEGLSIRIVFPFLKESELNKFSIPWWEILEAESFWVIFGEKYNDAFPDLPNQE